MEKFKSNRRDIQFFSKKNGKLLILHSEQALVYAQRLEANPHVVSYEPCVLLEKEGMTRVSPLDIRGEYLDGSTTWESSFLVEYEGNTRVICELIEDAAQLQKRAVVEKLELSRRYWAGMGITDWKVVIFEAKEEFTQE